MNLIVEHAEVWAATIDDHPGGLVNVLSVLQEAGANLQSVISRRAPDEPGKGVVFVTPLQGDNEIAAAAQIGFNITQTLHSVRVTGQNRPGIVVAVAQKLADAGLNLRGFSSAVLGDQFIAHAAVDSLQDATAAISALESL